jgi:hypothetical protein
LNVPSVSSSTDLMRSLLDCSATESELLSAARALLEAREDQKVAGAV